MIISVYLDDDTVARLRKVADGSGRSIEDLAEAAVSEAAIGATRDEPKRQCVLQLAESAVVKRGVLERGRL